MENPESELVWYVMLRAVDQFHSEFRAYPGYFQDQVETDIVRLKVSKHLDVIIYTDSWCFEVAVKKNKQR